jgi:long-chain acyl-CoA synthetase
MSPVRNDWAAQGRDADPPNLVANALVCRALFDLNATSRIFGLAPLFHVTGFEIQLVGAFAAGASQVLTHRFHPSVALEAFLEHRPTFIIGAITAFIALMNHKDATREHFSSFEYLYSGGAPIPPAVIDAFAQRFERSIRTSYGITELTAPSHLAPKEGAIPVDPNSGALSIGVPIPGVAVIVVDDHHRPLERHEHGEIVVRGPGVMAGYWRKPAEAAEALKGSWMHTGDVGFFDEAGWFYLVDRKKDMISASGFKVWPREVGDVLYAFSGIREAAVIGAPDHLSRRDRPGFCAGSTQCRDRCDSAFRPLPKATCRLQVPYGDSCRSRLA